MTDLTGPTEDLTLGVLGSYGGLTVDQPLCSG
jgi:hypothetical protein